MLSDKRQRQLVVVVRRRVFVLLTLLVAGHLSLLLLYLRVNSLVIVINDGCDSRMKQHRQRGHNDRGIKPVPLVNNPAHRGDGTEKKTEEEFWLFPDHLLEERMR